MLFFLCTRVLTWVVISTELWFFDLRLSRHCSYSAYLRHHFDCFSAWSPFIAGLWWVAPLEIYFSLNFPDLIHHLIVLTCSSKWLKNNFWFIWRTSLFYFFQIWCKMSCMTCIKIVISNLFSCFLCRIFDFYKIFFKTLINRGEMKWGGGKWTLVGLLVTFSWQYF